MIPVASDCPLGWTREYWGYLMTEAYSSKANSDFVCVDEDAEDVPFSHGAQGGAKLNPVENSCYVLPCNLMLVTRTCCYTVLTSRNNGETAVHSCI